MCQMEFEAGDEVATLPCTHFYHPDCIGQWLQDRKVHRAPLWCIKRSSPTVERSVQSPRRPVLE